MMPDHANDIPADKDANGVEASSSGRTEPEICACCHKPLTKRGADGECLRCLVGFALTPEDTDGDVARTSPPERPRQQNVIYGHFELAAAEDGSLLELGHGAMGTTYRAQDTVLRTAVALKVIEQSVAEHPAARARFLREARAAANLHHPNVATVSHYGEQDGQCYYVMELVEGETVEARVRRDGPLPVALALEIAAQVARALSAAEARGIVHRDLKPSNLMLATTEREKDKANIPLVKVIDFGLAKVVSDVGGQEKGAADTRSGFVGTPAFASPEQFARAEDTRVDSRSDIYSLGVTLWYLLCGRSPFLGTTLEEIHAQQIKEPLPLKQLTAGKIPARVIALLRSMLAVHPRDRFQSARELLDAITRCQDEFPLIQRKLSHVGRRRRRTLFAGLLAIGGIVMLAGWWHFRGSPPPPTDASVAVLPFENLSPDESDTFFTVGMQDEITTDLAHIAALKVVSSDSTRLYPPKDRNITRIGQELGAAYLLEGSVRRTEARVTVIVRLVKARDSSRVWTNQYDRPLNEVFAVQSEIVRAVANRLQVSLTPGERVAVDGLPTSDLVAYDLYLRARDGVFLTATDAETIREQKRKITLLEKAVARDPSFFLAYCELAKAHDYLQLRRYAAPVEEQAVDHRAIAEGYLATARRLQPDAGELHLAQALHFFFSPATRAQARTEVDLAVRSLPNNSEVAELAGRLALGEGRWEESVRSYQRAVELAPRNTSTLYNLAQTYRFLRRYDDFERTISRAMEISSKKEWVGLPLELTMGAVEGRADTAPLRAALANYSVSSEEDSSEKVLFSLVLYLDDHDSEALSRLLAASKKNEFIVFSVAYPRAWFEGLAARMRGDDAGARAAFAEARPAMEKLMLSSPSSARLPGLLAIVDAGLGRAEAIDEAQRACAMPVYPANRPLIGCNLAVVYAWLGQPDLACAELEKWVDQPASGNIQYQLTYGDLRLNPFWDPLRSNPRFEALTQRLAPKR